LKTTKDSAATTSPLAKGITWIDFLPAAVGASQTIKLSQLYVGTPMASGVLAGLFAILGFGVILAISSAIRLRATSCLRTKPMQATVSIAVSVSLAIALVIPAMLLHQSISDTSPRIPFQAPQGLKVLSTFQDAEGMTDEQVTPETASIWATAVLQSAQTLGKQGCLDQGGTVAGCQNLRWTESHSVISNDQQKIVLINIEAIADAHVHARMVRVLSIKGKQMVSVACARFDDIPVTVYSGPCADEIGRSFGFRL
jgi:hypothetical protein